jgi:zinc/manganese transport system substrate-binding protein
MSLAPRLVVGMAVGVALLATGCNSGLRPGVQGDKPTVIAAEDFWGSIASQLGGDHVSVMSVITNPNADPHDYEPTTADARDIATAAYVIENGIGYDPWVQRLLDSNPTQGRAVLNVGNLVGVQVGENPHQWYSPDSVQKVIDAITAEYKKLDPKDADAFEKLRSTYENEGLAEYHRLIDEMRSKYAGTAVGASESIFAELAPALGLRLITPPAFLTAISEGTDPTAVDKATIDRQIASHEIKVYVYNRQNATPDVQQQIQAAQRVGIPVTTITETLVPAGATFQAWQVGQLRSLETALARGTES